MVLTSDSTEWYFCYGLKVCLKSGYISSIFSPLPHLCFFVHIVNFLNLFLAVQYMYCGFLGVQLLLQVLTVCVEILQAYSTWSEDVYSD